MPKVMVVGGVADYSKNNFRRKLEDAGFEFDPARDHVAPSAHGFTRDVSKYDGVIILKGMTGPNQPAQVKALCKGAGVPFAEVPFKWALAWPIMERSLKFSISISASHAHKPNIFVSNGCLTACTSIPVSSMVLLSLAAGHMLRNSLSGCQATIMSNIPLWASASILSNSGLFFIVSWPD